MRMKPIIDIHSHILPDVDDGCSDKTRAIVMLAMYEEQGVESLICTPHYGPCMIKGANIKETFNWLESVGSPVKLFLGNEVYFTPHTLRDVRRQKALTLAGSKFVLIEFEEWCFHTDADVIYNSLKWFSQSEYTPVLAHAERYESLQRSPGFYERLTKSGVKLQLNAYDIYESDNYMTRKTAQDLLQKQLVSFIGSDAHNTTYRSPALRTGVKWIYDHCPESYADAVVHDNAEKIIGGA